MSGIAYFNPNLAQDANGNPSGLAKAYFYNTGTTTPQTVYEDAGLTTPHPQPLISDASGNFAAVYSAGVTDLKVVVTDSADATLPGYPIDPAILQTSGASAGSVSFAPTARIASDTVQEAIEEVDASVKALEDDASQNSTITTTGGTTTAYTLAVSGVTSYTANDRYWVRCNATNTAACTINVQSVGAKDIKKYDDSGSIAALSAGDFAIGSEYLLHYDGTQFVVISERLARAADSVWATGTSTVPYAASPKNARATALATTVGTDLWTPFANVAIVSGASGSIAYSGFTIIAPYDCYLTCLTAEHGYSAGDVVYVGLNGGNPSNKGVTFYISGTHPFYILGSNATVFSGVHATTGAAVNFTNANWDMTIEVLTKSDT